ncbi:hypothetical protein [Micromonospora sp. NPDC005710]|uniref:hypothetical protein n=1 Tax=Micromonospora sp. NPDC005710 TaxID=3157051 RepID=UPI0033D90920
MEYYFRESRALHGVVFVAANGFDHVWPDKRNDVSRQLTRYQLDYLRKRNRRKELDRFKETCQVLAERLLATDANTPRWLLVVANKADLYWNEIAAAEKYYLPGSGSDFDDVAQELLSEVGRGNLQYDVLPLATAPVDYRFQSTRGLLESRTQLNTIQCSASIACLAEALEARCDA